MKLFVISDIHGSSIWLNKALKKFEEEKADYILLLGDILYHGPRNNIPEGYNPKEVIKILENYKNKIMAVRGNCDGEVDQMVLSFPVLADYAILFYNEKRIFATHGHNYNKEKKPNIMSGDIFIQGHTHVPVAEYDKQDGITYLNPGSITIPKENNPNSYGIFEDNKFKVKDFEGNVIRKIELK